MNMNFILTEFLILMNQNFKISMGDFASTSKQKNLNSHRFKWDFKKCKNPEICGCAAVWGKASLRNKSQ